MSQEYQSNSALSPVMGFGNPEFDDELQPRPQYYGHKPLNGDEHSGQTETSEQIESNLLQYVSSREDVKTALKSIFSDPGWLSQMEPVHPSLIQIAVLRPEVPDEQGIKWYPCQLGCPNGVPLTGTQITEPNHATEHIEWHLGMRRYPCDICKRTFLRNRDRNIHQQGHEGGSPVYCPSCGKKFSKPSNLTRHRKDNRCSGPQGSPSHST